MKTTSTHSVHCAVRERLSNTNLSKKTYFTISKCRQDHTVHRQQQRKPGKYGKSQKSPEGDNRAMSASHVHTNMTPDVYLQVLGKTDLKEDEKLPHTIMSHWKIINDQSNFPKECSRGRKCMATMKPSSL